MACNSAYNSAVATFREREYPMLKGTTYLDHAGTTLYARSLTESFSTKMISNLYGNPHSASSSSQRSSQLIDDVRLKVLRLFKADPEAFDVVFVANATAGIKLVGEGFHGHKSGFAYSYHSDSHTSLVGLRELAKEHICRVSDGDVDEWIAKNCQERSEDEDLHLFAYPAQSNMNGRRLPLRWCSQIRSRDRGNITRTYTLVDAAALVSTTPLDLSDVSTAPDFTVTSFYKTFGFPDVGALIVRKESGEILDSRRYFGGGTVDMVACTREQWHIRKTETLHDRLEDGTLPIHSILALDAAIDTHDTLFRSLRHVANHSLFLAREMHERLSTLKHSNGVPVCELYCGSSCSYDNATTQGPIIAFNIRNSRNAWVSVTEVEKLAAVRKIELRTGGLCNPGGTAKSLKLAPWEMKRNFAEGQRCGNENDILFGKPTGMIRISFGAMSTMEDVATFDAFMREFFVEEAGDDEHEASPTGTTMSHTTYVVESLTIYPIKSCRGWGIVGKAWPVRREGLEWDREWCLVHSGTSISLSQKRYPNMALLQPSIDLQAGRLHVRYIGNNPDLVKTEVDVPLSADPRCFKASERSRSHVARVCGEEVSTQVYNSSELSTFFSQALGVSCELARCPPSISSAAPLRYSKARMQPHQLRPGLHIPGAFTEDAVNAPVSLQPMLLANESPILVIHRSSLNRLNEQIKARGGKAAQADVFRANIVVAEDFRATPGAEQPYVEDHWRHIMVGGQLFQMLGACRRCQMICIDQHTAEKNEEPFVTLARTRRFEGKVYFGQHACHVAMPSSSSPSTQYPTINVGDSVCPFLADDLYSAGIAAACV